MREKRLFEYQGHWLLERSDTPNLHIYWCKPGTRRVCRKSTHTSDPEEAKRRLIAFVHETQGIQDTAPSKVALLDVLADYVELTSAGKPFWPAAKTALQHFAEFCEANDIVYVSEMTPDSIDRYIQWRRERLIGQGFRASNGTINRELTVLRAALRRLWKRGKLDSFPHVGLLPNPPPRQRFLTQPEAVRLLGACHEPHLRTFVSLALHTLQRPGAIFGLTVGQVDLEAGRIDFLPPGEAPTFKRKPVVPINRSLRPVLEAAISQSQSGHVVEYKGRPVRSVKKSFRRACESAGLSDVSPYTLRHTGATLMAAKGVRMREIAGMLGHSQERTTELYAKHHPDFLSSAADTLDALFGLPEATDSGSMSSKEAHHGRTIESDA